MSPDAVVVKNEEFIVTETRLKSEVAPEVIISLLRAHRTTGSLTMEFFEGGIRNVFLSEKRKPSETQRTEIRKILNRS